MSDSRAVQHLLFGELTVRRLWFAQPYRGIDFRRANAYLTRATSKHDRIALCGIPDDLQYTLSEMASGKYAALKMYPHYFEPAATRIREYFPTDVLAAAEQRSMPLVVHVARRIEECAGEIEEIANTYPGLQIILAHYGRAVTASRVVAYAFERILPLENVFMDCSAVHSREVHMLAMATLGSGRILFGSDEPMCLLRMEGFLHPEDGYRFTSPHPYHWLAERHRVGWEHLAAKAILLHWRVLENLIAAIDQVYATDASAAITAVFSRNAERLLPGITDPSS